MHELSKTIKSYDKQAKWHSSKFDSYDLSAYLQAFVKLLKGKKVLDLGCGNGRDLEFFHKHNLNAVGIDLSDEMIHEAKRRVKDAKILKMNFLKKLKFSDDEFDGVWSSASLLHIPKDSLDKTMSELKRILKRKGILFISVKEGKGERNVKDDYGSGQRHFSFFKKGELSRRLKLNGFDILQSYSIPDSKLRIRNKNKKQTWLMLYSIKQ